MHFSSFYTLNKIPIYKYLLFSLLLFGFTNCKSPQQPLIPAIDDDDPTPIEKSTDTSVLTIWNWHEISIPEYSWPNGVGFGDGLFVDVAFDTTGVKIQDNQIKFRLNPNAMEPPSGAHSPFNYRSEIHTMPWNIEHPVGTEQWIGWRFTFGQDYVIDHTSPITIFQNHPGVRGMDPQFELEIAALDNPRPAKGGEIQVVNTAALQRNVYPVIPKAGETLDLVIHVIYGDDSEGMLQVWMNGMLYYDEQIATVYSQYPWGGNNKWGVYHHTFNNSQTDVESSLAIGAGIMDLYMGPLKMITRVPDHPEYGVDAYDLVRPE